MTRFLVTVSVREYATFYERAIIAIDADMAFDIIMQDPNVTVAVHINWVDISDEFGNPVAFVD